MTTTTAFTSYCSSQEVLEALRLSKPDLKDEQLQQVLQEQWDALSKDEQDDFQPKPQSQSMSYEDKVTFLIDCLTESAQEQGVSFQELTSRLVKHSNGRQRHSRDQPIDDLQKIKRATTTFHKRYAQGLKRDGVFLPQVLHHFVTHKRSATPDEVVPRGINGRPPNGQPCRLPKLRCYHDLKSLFSDIDPQTVKLVWGTGDKTNRILWEYIPTKAL